MTRAELIERIGRGENRQTEFKSVFDSAERIARTVVAFANLLDGGWLIFGVNEDGSIGGVANPEQVERQVRKVCQENCIPAIEPEIETIPTADGIVLVVNIEGRHPPYRASDQHFWVRRDTSTIPLQLDELLDEMLGRPRETVSHQIVRFRARYFRSLYDVDIPLKPLNVFIGPNGSGKSNLFHLLRFLQWAASTSQAGRKYEKTAQELIWLGKGEEGERPDSFQVELLCTIPEQIERTPLRYTLRVAPDDTNNLRFVEESLLPFVTEGLSTPKSYIERRGRDVRVHVLSESGRGPGGQRHYPLDRDHLALQFFAPMTDSPVVKDIQHYLTGWRVFDVDVREARKSTQLPREPKQVPPLNENGGNLDSFLYALQSLQPDDWEEIKWHLKEIDFFSDLELKLAPGISEFGTEYRFWEKAFDEFLSAESVSDGTIYFLAHLALLLGDHTASLICLEEPDRNIHPKLMRSLASVLCRVATSDDPERSPQVLLTTHDPALLNWFEPDLGKDYFQVVVTEKDPTSGKSTFRVLEAEKLTHWLDTFRLGQLHEKGILDDYGRGDRG